MVRVRIAPSPTGSVHIGLVRSALYNWLFARHHKGRFILRIEDTDPTRSTKESLNEILEGFEWVGLQPDEGPYFQSQRFELYRRYAEKLLKEGRAYYCYCSEERLEQERKRAEREHRVWKYDRRCLSLSSEERERLEREKAPKVVRFLIPPKKVEFEDIIHGRIEKSPQDLDDFIILRRDGSPTYNFACVIDDAEMEITHVIRAVEHIANTPKQVLLYEALGFKPPKFAHLPLILGKDKKKLSKRHGAVSLLEYRRMGYLPEAILNYLALLGWSPGGDKEIMSIEEMIESFTLEKVHKANAIFDERKLLWMNGEYMRMLPRDRILKELKRFINLETEDERLLKLVDLLRVRTKTLRELCQMMEPYIREEIEYDGEAVERFILGKEERVRWLYEEFSLLKDFTAPSLEKSLRDLALRKRIKAAELIHPARVAVTGKSVGPPLFDALELIGRDRTLKRLKRWI